MEHVPSTHPHGSSTDVPASQHAAAAPPKAFRRALRTIWFVIKALEIRLRFIALLVGIGLTIAYWETLKNYWEKWARPDGGAAAGLSDGTEYYCPMHPSVVRSEADPGGTVPKCPICGMPLSKRKKGALPELPEGVISRVQFSPYRIQLAGIRTVRAELRPLVIELRTAGYVTLDERRRARLVVRAGGYVEKLYVNVPFAEVAAGQPLAEVYSPDLYLAAQELLLARRGSSTQLVEFSREKLRLLGVADEEIDAMLRTGQAAPRLVLRAPFGGHVFEKRVVEGDAVHEGQVLFEVADLSTVWIEADIYEKDLPLVRPGQTVLAMIEGYSGPPASGRVSLVHPHVQPATRSVRVRFELPNPNHALRPGMFATVLLQVPLQEVEPFRSRLAEARPRSLAGNTAGTATAAPGTGSRAGAASDPSGTEALAAVQRVCPVTGLKLGSMGPPVKASYGSPTVFLCCAACQDDFASQPEYYLSRLTLVSEQGVLAVPETAVIDTGTQKVVYVEREPGLFEGVLVTVGPLAGGYYPVVEGLLPGDRVAATGAFLIDAETRLNPAAATAYFGASGGPSAGAAAVPAAAPAPSEGAQGSNGLPASKAQENLAKLPRADRQRAMRQGTCPISGLALGTMGVPYKMNVQGRILYLCCQACEQQVNQDPQGVLERLQGR
ncbi:MAG: efflux RND transporter periplasmic adaptor subunit [Pirellulales bacterium]|nr:efflux RND transporter periplasmic adaptor subunit [Pirellulales bacterium]